MDPVLKEYLDAMCKDASEIKASISSNGIKLSSMVHQLESQSAQLSDLCGWKPDLEAATTPSTDALLHEGGDDLTASMPSVSGCVVGPVMASSGTSELVTASAGLAEPLAPAPTIATSLVVAPAVPTDTIVVALETCSTECPGYDDTEPAHASTRVAAPTSATVTVDVIRLLAATAASDGAGEAIKGAASTAERSLAVTCAVPRDTTVVVHAFCSAECVTQVVTAASTTPPTLLRASGSSSSQASSKPRPIPWPSFVVLPGGVHLTEPRPTLQESKEAMVSGLISRGATVFKLWHIPWYSFLFLELTSEAPYDLALFQWEMKLWGVKCLFHEKGDDRLLQSLDKAPSVTKVVLELFLRIGQYFPTLECENLRPIAQLFGNKSSSGMLELGPFICLPHDCQELAIACLYYFSNLLPDIIEPLACSCLSDKLEPLILFRIVEFLQSTYKAGILQITEQLSLLALDLSKTIEVGFQSDKTRLFQYLIKPCRIMFEQNDKVLYCTLEMLKSFASGDDHMFSSVQLLLFKLLLRRPYLELPMVPRDIPVRSQPIMQFMGNLNLDDVEGRPIFFAVQSSYKFCPQEAQSMFRFSQTTVRLKLPSYMDEGILFQQITSQSWEFSGFFQQIFEPVGPSIVKDCYGLSCSNGSPTKQQLTLPVPDEDVYRHEDTQAAIYVHKSWDPGGVTMPAFNLQSSKILMSMLTSQEAQAMSGYVDHKYYISFCNDYFLDISFDRVAICHGYYNTVVQVNHDFELVKEHRVHWDPGGPRRRRLGVKPNFKEGGMLGALLTCTHTWACPLGPAHGPGRCSHK